MPFVSWFTRLAGRDCAAAPFFALTPRRPLFRGGAVRSMRQDRAPRPANRDLDRPRPFRPGCACHVALIGPHLLEHHWPKRGGQRRLFETGGAIGVDKLPIGSEASSPAAAELGVPQQPCIRYDPLGSGTMMQSCASSAELRRAGPFYNSGTKAMGGSGTPPPRIVIGNVPPESGRTELGFSWLPP